MSPGRPQGAACLVRVALSFLVMTLGSLLMLLVSALTAFRLCRTLTLMKD